MSVCPRRSAMPAALAAVRRVPAVYIIPLAAVVAVCSTRGIRAVVVNAAAPTCTSQLVHPRAIIRAVGRGGWGPTVAALRPTSQPRCAAFPCSQSQSNQINC